MVEVFDWEDVDLFCCEVGYEVWVIELGFVFSNDEECLFMVLF